MQDLMPQLDLRDLQLVWHVRQGLWRLPTLPHLTGLWELSERLWNALRTKDNAPK